jgi:hypothetical protein
LRQSKSIQFALSGRTAGVIEIAIQIAVIRRLASALVGTITVGIGIPKDTYW